MPALLVLLAAAQPAPAASDLPALISQLGSEECQERDEATAILRKAGLQSLPELRRALAATKDPEVQLRLQSIILDIERPDFAFQRSIDCGVSPEEPRDPVWSPDGRQLAVPLKDHVVVYDTETRRPLHTHEGSDLVPFYSAKGDRLALADPQKEGVRILSTKTFAPVELEWFDKPHGSPLIFDDGTYVVLENSRRPPSVSEYRLSDGQGRRETSVPHHQPELARFAASPDHRWVAATPFNVQSLTLWQRKRDDPPVDLLLFGPGDHLSAPVFSRDPSLIAVSDLGFINIVRTADGSRVILPFLGHEFDRVGFRHDGRYLLAGGPTEWIVAWDTHRLDRDSPVAKIKLEHGVDNPYVFAICASPVDDRFVLLWVKDSKLGLSLYRLVGP